MSKIVDLHSLDKKQLKTFVDSFDHVLSDCDGVVWTKGPMQGSGEFFELMQRLGKTVHFVSNNSLRTDENYKKMFDSCSIENGVNRLAVPSYAIAEYLKTNNFSKHVYSCSSEETTRVLEASGIKCKQGPEKCLDKYSDYVEYCVDDPEIGAVVLDSDFKINMAKMYKAITYLKRPDVLFISGAPDKTIPLRPGLTMFGPGIFIDLVAKETNRQPTVIAKPGKIFGEFAMRKAGITEPERVLFIGDTIDQDIGLGRTMGFKTLLLFTTLGKAEMMAHKTIKPDFTINNLGELVPQLKELV